MASAIDLELFRRVETEPPGTFKLFHADGSGAGEQIQQHLANLDEIKGRIEHADRASCFIESMSLRLQIIDYWLRIFFIGRRPNVRRQREFGRLLEQCGQLGLDKDLQRRITDFNRHRINAIHGYVVGTVGYDTVATAAAAADKLLRETVIFVVSNVGSVVISRNELAANPGALLIHVEGFCEDIRKGRRY